MARIRRPVAVQAPPALPSVACCLLLTESYFTLCPSGAAQGSAGLNAVSRLPGCSTLFWQEQVKGQPSSLVPRTELSSQPGSGAGKRFQQLGRPAEQRREVKPAWVKRGPPSQPGCALLLCLRGSRYQQGGSSLRWLGVAELVSCSD